MSLRENLPLELHENLGRFLRTHYPLQDPEAPVEYYGDYFKEPTSDIDVRRLQQVLGPVPTAVLYSSVSDYEVHFHVGLWHAEDEDPILVAPPPWNWEQALDALRKETTKETKAQRAIRQVIVLMHQLLASFAIDWHYLHINPTHEPRLFRLQQALLDEGLPLGLDLHFAALRDYQHEQRQRYEAEMRRLEEMRQRVLMPQDIHGWEQGRVQSLQREVAQALGKPVAFRDPLQAGGVGPEMLIIPPGRFRMGSPGGEPERDGHEGPQHEVAITKPFALGRYAVTFAEYDAYCTQTGKEPPDDAGWGRGERPVIHVSWHEAVAYCRWLSAQTGATYRLPTEAEWEYACRAGTETPFWWGTTITLTQANYDGNYPYNNGPKGEHRGKTVPVDQFAPNPWGLYQMHGNVREWTQDAWHGTYEGAPSDGSAWETGAVRVLRGGCWLLIAGNCRSASRTGRRPGDRFSALGFRCARVQE